MSEYGLRIQDAAGNTVKITPIVGSIVAAGIYNSPASLNVDNTYGFNVDLPGTAEIPFANLSVIAIPRSWTWNAYLVTIAFGSPVTTRTKNFYFDSSLTYYTIGVNGVMSTWSAGNITPTDDDTWDPLLTSWGLAEWMLEDDDLYTSVRIFPAVANLGVDTSAGTTISAYFLYGVPTTDLGVATSHVVVILKEWDF